MSEQKTAVFFGGSGFIGQHFAVYLIQKADFNKVVLADISEPELGKTTADFDILFDSGEIEFARCDVRKPIQLGYAPELIANLAAVHREPGHELNEYYDTNIPGAENVCAWADAVGCKKLIFTSSIAPYGPTEEPMMEKSIPHPVTGYGGSKLAAEHIHRTWQAKSPGKKLVISRPGVVFGAGEGGNVTRLIKAYSKGYFFYMGNQQTRKSGTYVKELCHAMHWVLENECEGVALFNMSMNPAPTVQQYIEVIKKVSGKDRFVPKVPYTLFYAASLVIDRICKLLGIDQPISPVRLKKLVKSNNIVPIFLAEVDYPYQFTFEEAMADWKQDKPSEWLN